MSGQDIDEIKARLCVRTDHELATALHVGRSTVTSWRRRGHVPARYLHSINPARSTEEIVAAAILVDGVILSLPRPARHGHIMAAARFIGSPLHWGVQGFLTSSGRFVNRVQAKQLAHIAGQKQLRPPEARHDADLYSEDLW